MKSLQVNAKAAPANESDLKPLLLVMHCQWNVLSATQEVAFTLDYLASGEQHSKAMSVNDVAISVSGAWQGPLLALSIELIRQILKYALLLAKVHFWYRQ